MRNTKIVGEKRMGRKDKTIRDEGNENGRQIMKTREDFIGSKKKLKIPLDRSC